MMIITTVSMLCKRLVKKVRKRKRIRAMITVRYSHARVIENQDMKLINIMEWVQVTNTYRG